MSMRRPLLLLLTMLTMAAFSAGARSEPLHVHHRLQVDIRPATGVIEVTDELRPGQTGPLEFRLHKGLNPRVHTQGVDLERSGESQDGRFETFRLTMPTDITQVTLHYAGRIAHEFSQHTDSPGRQRELVDGTISSDGVLLSAAVAWYPVIEGALASFDLQVSLPEGWLAVSQGRGPGLSSDGARQVVTWDSDTPQDDIYLVAGRFSLYRARQDGIESQVFLLSPDPQLAQRFLDATASYLRRYSELIGDYPYHKFALVENFWQTGYGMPSFTLLGSRVIRLPFILHSSYPHEILHNWWGNGVYVDYASGNWAEGLTAYLADHWIKEQQGQGVAHRRTALQRFAAFVRDDNDFPMVEFRSRHSGSSQAVGYDKAMMAFHMLRRKLGDELFVEGLRRLYRDNRFRFASYDDLKRAFEQASGRDLGDFFGQWTERKGAPALEVSDSVVTQHQEGYRLSLILRQAQAEPAFELDVPLVVYREGGLAPVHSSVEMTQREQAFVIETDARPMRVDIDPWLDLFRVLHPSESPPVLSELFGASRALFVLPSDAPSELLEGYRQLARSWAQGYDEAEIRLDSDVDGLSAERANWLLGWNNRWLPGVTGELPDATFAEIDTQVSVLGETSDRADHSYVLARRLDSGPLVGWLGSERAAALPGLARKLPHYGRYGLLVFEGDEPSIRRKAQWPLGESAMSIRFGGETVTIPPPPALQAGRSE